MRASLSLTLFLALSLLLGACAGLLFHVSGGDGRMTKGE